MEVPVVTMTMSGHTGRRRVRHLLRAMTELTYSFQP